MQDNPPKISLFHAKPSELKPNPDNPRKITPKAIRHLVKSLETYGWVQPIVVKSIPPEGDMKWMVMDGNHRFQASKFLPEQDIPCVPLPEGLTAQQEYEFIFRINRHYAEYDKERVKEKMKSDFPELVNAPTFEELGIDFLKPDFLAEAPAEMSDNAPMDEKLEKFENLKAAVEQILQETQGQIEKSFVMFVHNGNRYCISLIEKETFVRLRNRQEADPVTFQAFVADVLDSNLG